MKCPNCKYEFSDGNRCPKCQIDAALYKRTNFVSYALYNEGLEKAKLSNLTGAISALEKSLEFNKSNVNARNLLGLIYFEIGRIGDAAKHWVLSTNLFKKENAAFNYLDLIQKNSKLVERLNDSTLMFNQALSYLSQKSEDLAVIQLKRALEYNPKFIDALNLLSLCYYTQHETDKAKQTVERTLAIDNGNTTALRYYHEMFGKAYIDKEAKNSKSASPRHDTSRFEATKPEGFPIPQLKPSFASQTPNVENSFRDNFHVSEIITFIVGGICAFAIFYILILPNEIRKRDETITGISTDLAAKEQQLDNEIKIRDDEITILITENNDLKTSVSKLEAEIILLERVQRVNQLEAVYNSGNLEEAILLIAGVESAGMPADVLDRYNTIRNETYGNYSKQMNDAGVKSYNAKNYDQARTEFETCVKYAEGMLGVADNALYMLGLMADNAKDYETAIKYYQMVHDDYPDSSRASTVTKRLNALK